MKRIISCLALVLTFGFTSCDNDNPGDTAFDNKLFINQETMESTILTKLDTHTVNVRLNAAMAKTSDMDVTLTYAATPENVGTYNEAYYSDAVILHEKYYNFVQTEDVIHAGGITSDGIEIRFSDLDKLDRDLLYVLPVSIVRSDIDILQSGRTIYYVFKGAALINVVGDIEASFLWIPKWKDATRLNGLTTLTMEALIRVRNFDRPISTLMGVENHFLIRFGDANYPGQIQVASSKKNFPEKDAAKVLPTGRWVHVAITYASAQNDLKIYVDGKLQSEGGFPGGAMRAINLGKSHSLDQESEITRGFWIGHSYAADRYLSGEISECRIWNVVRTQEEIAQNPYYVAPDSPGLVAYWKFDEGNGSVVKDYASGNDLMVYDVANAPMRWTPVELPQK